VKTNRGLARLSVLVAIICSLPTASFAAPFGNEFQIVKATGGCEIKKTGADKFEPLTEQSRYAYGSTVKTAEKSSCVVKFAEANGCLVYEKTDVSFTQEDGGKTKLLTLVKGGVELDLAKGFRTDNELKIKTPNALCTAIACAFSVEYLLVGDLKTTFVNVTEGEIGLDGSYFSVAGLDAGDKLNVAESPEGDMIRIKAVKGEVTVVGMDTDGTERKVALKTDDIMEIIIKPSDTPGMVDVVYRVVFADPEREQLIWQVTRRSMVTPLAIVPAGNPAATDWDRIAVTPPRPSATPVGKQ